VRLISCPTCLAEHEFRKANTRACRQLAKRVVVGDAAPELLAALKLHLAFLKTLPPGWLGKTSGDVGLLNDAYLASEKALKNCGVMP